MQPRAALLLACACIVGAFIVDSRRQPRASLALWIPLTWTAILQSRPIALWLNPGPIAFNANLEDGSAIDRAVLSMLMLMAAAVLYNRKVHWGKWLQRNAWLVAFLLYCGVSVLWSDFPAVALKRWVRALGSVMMILVVLTDDDPVAAIGTLMRRCAYVLVPLSLVLIKYYRDRAVTYNFWTGEEYLIGITTDKNALGRLCLLSGLFLFWDLLTEMGRKVKSLTRLNWLAALMVLGTTLWLLKVSMSSTSLGTFVIGMLCLLVLGRPIIIRNTRHLGVLFLVSALVITAVSISFNLVEGVVTRLGRDMTFTDRTFVWADLLALNTNPLVGVGYDSFWLGDRLDRFLRVHQVAEAHNGYLEVYLELGLIGLCFLAGLVMSVFLRSKHLLTTNLPYGRLRLTVLAIFLVYNITEAGYKMTTSIFFVLLLIAIEAPARICEESAPIASHRRTPLVQPRLNQATTAGRAQFGTRRIDDNLLGRRVKMSSHAS